MPQIHASGNEVPHVHVQIAGLGVNSGIFNTIV